MSSNCSSCPFNDGITEEATQAQNWGCLPSSFDMLNTFDKTGIAISCHADESTPCRGISDNRNTKDSPILKYTDWYHGSSQEQRAVIARVAR